MLESLWYKQMSVNLKANGYILLCTCFQYIHRNKRLTVGKFPSVWILLLLLGLMKNPNFELKNGGSTSTRVQLHRKKFKIPSWNNIGILLVILMLPILYQWYTKKCKFRYANIHVGTLLDNNKLLLVNLTTPIPIM